jgi:uncharacterized damage-inducible protein DinB
MEIVDWIVEHVDVTFRKGNWAGPGVLPALDALTVEDAAWRPNLEQKTVGEMIRHMAYWKDAVTARLTGAAWEYKEEDNWRPVPATAEGLDAARAELTVSHGRLLEALRALRPERLHERVGRAWWREPVDPLSPYAAAYADEVTPGQAKATVIDFALGAAQHDMYHAAQIFVLRRGFKAQRR